MTNLEFIKKAPTDSNINFYLRDFAALILCSYNEGLLIGADEILDNKAKVETQGKDCTFDFKQVAVAFALRDVCDNFLNQDSGYDDDFFEEAEEGGDE